jgi:hypothetical protein
MLSDESTWGGLIAAGLEIRGTPSAVDSSPDRRIYRAMDSPDPIAFVTSDPARRLSYSVDQSGVVVTTAGLLAGTNVTVNFLRWPWITAEANGIPLKPVADRWDRIEITLPSAASQISIRYSPPWGQSFAAAGLLLITALATGWFAARQKTFLSESICANEY